MGVEWDQVEFPEPSKLRLFVCVCVCMSMLMIPFSCCLLCLRPFLVATRPSLACTTATVMLHLGTVGMWRIQTSESSARYIRTPFFSVLGFGRKFCVSVCVEFRLAWAAPFYSLWCILKWIGV